jgi:predicted PurR-regulated permease PerM
MTLNTRPERTAAIVVLSALVIGCFVVLRPFLSPLLWAVILTFSTWPIYVRSERFFRGRKALAALAMIVLATLLLVIPAAIVVTSLTGNVADLAAAARRLLANGPPTPPDWIADLPMIGRRVHDRWQSFANDGTKFTQELQPYVGMASNWILQLGASVGGSILELLMSLLIAFFLYRDGRMAATRLEVVSERLAGERARALLRVATGTIKGVVYGILGTNLVQGILAAIGFWLSGVPGALLLGFLAFFLTTIPGAPIVLWAPAVLWLLRMGDTGPAIFLGLWCVVIFGPLENVVRPFLISRGSDLPVILILFGMIGGLLAFGFLGIFLGPVLLAVCFTLAEEWSAPKSA